MALLAATNPTIADWVKRQGTDGKQAAVAELLTQTNEMLDDMTMIPGNLPTGHRVTIRTGLPTIYWRAFNEGVLSSKSSTAQVDEALGMMEARSTIDCKLAELNGNTAEFRLSEDRPFLEGMNQEQQATVLYANPGASASSDAKKYLGLSARYSSLSAGNAANIISAGGSTAASQASIWLVCWSPETVFGIYPKGTLAGLRHRDLGEQTVYNVNGVAGTQMQAYVSLFQWDLGLVVRDWRYAVRIPNIETSQLLAFTGAQQLASYGTNILHCMARALYRLPSFSMGRCAFYMNRTVHSGLTRMAMEKSANALAIQEGLNQFGHARKWLTFMGVKCGLVDGLLNTEDVVS